MPASEPGYGAPAAPQQAALPEAYSVAPGDGAANRAARADGVAANHMEDKQNLQGGPTKARRIDDVTKLVAEEAASRSKFPRYAGLERWELIEKMGDGAFSNVYRARDLEGDAGEVAIKVVRKFEMNSMQVSTRKTIIGRLFPITHCRGRLFSLFSISGVWRDLAFLFVPFTNMEGVVLGPKTSPSGLQTKGSKSRRGARNFIIH